MYSFQEDTTLVGVTELRTRLKEVQKALKKNKVILQLRHKPLAVLVPLDHYRKMEELLETLEDRSLGSLAKERDRATRSEDYLTLAEVEKQLKLK